MSKLMSDLFFFYFCLGRAWRLEKFGIGVHLQYNTVILKYTRRERVCVCVFCCVVE